MRTGYLVDHDARLRCVADPDTGVTEVSVRGRWGPELRTAVARALRACVAETPRLLLVDLARLSDPDGDSVTTWRIAHRYATERIPPVDVVVCAPAPQVRDRLSVTADEAVSVAESLDAARVAGPRLPIWPQRRTLRLPPLPAAARLARAAVTDMCDMLHLSSLRGPAELIVNELTANAAEHAGTDLDVAAALRGDVLHLAVRDESPVLPRPVTTDPGTDLLTRGVGLRIVDAAATAWGAMPCRVGKVVWATLSLDPRIRP
jgi:hypothetical protein